MYVLEEYLAVTILAVVLGVAGMAVVVLVLTLLEDDHFFDRAFLTGTFALPPSWPRIWLAMRIGEMWRAMHMSFGRHAELWWRRVCSRP